ncbi:MAG: acetolactate synthase small subunit, partial [Clostridia bacterium]
MANQHVLSILVQNRPGVLTRISGLFSRRGYNIDSLSVCATEDDNYSRMTISLGGNDRIVSQILSQLEKQVDVVKVEDFANAKSVFRELLIIKIQCNAKQRSEIVDICTIFYAKTIDISADDTM